MFSLKPNWERIIIGTIALAVLVAALREHDARILAEQTVQESAARVSSLEDEVKAVSAKGAAEVQAVKKSAAAVKTPAQAIASIATVSEAALQPRELPDAPSSVQVEAIPLYQALATCKETGIELQTCTAKSELTEKVIAEKDIQIQALKKKKSFWKRLGSGAKSIGCAAGGAAVGSIVSGGKGAAIGAAGGVSLCSVL